MPAALAIGEHSGWRIDFSSFGDSANLCGLPATFGGESLIRRTGPSTRCEQLKEARRRGDQAFVSSLAGSDSI
jgi:hypothetical protein